MSGMTPERLAEAREFLGVEPGMVGVIARAVLRERDYYAAEVERLRAQVAAVERVCTSAERAQSGQAAMIFTGRVLGAMDAAAALASGEVTP